MPAERAIWYPFWYGLDQPIAVGAVADFDFFVKPPEAIVNEGLPVFYHGDWHERCRHLYDRRRKRILSIWHPVLDSIRKIETSGLDYTFAMADGRALKVEAEETPGLVYAHPEPITDWRIFVEMETA